jgi:hypothetical protein
MTASLVDDGSEAGANFDATADAVDAVEAFVACADRGAAIGTGGGGIYDEKR